MLTTRLLRSPLLKKTSQLIVLFRPEHSHCSLRDYDLTLIKRYATLLAESMETIPSAPTIMLRSSDSLTVEEELLALLETLNPAVIYVPKSNTLGD